MEDCNKICGLGWCLDAVSQDRFNFCKDNNAREIANQNQQNDPKTQAEAKRVAAEAKRVATVCAPYSAINPHLHAGCIASAPKSQEEYERMIGPEVMQNLYGKTTADYSFEKTAAYQEYNAQVQNQLISKENLPLILVAIVVLIIVFKD